MADSFVFYKSFWDGIKALPDDSALRLFRAACAYGIDGETPDLDGLELAVFTSWKANIDSAQKKRRDGEKGGRPKKTSGFESENQWLSDEKPVVSDSKPMVSESKPKVSKSKSNENENENGNEDVNGKGKGRFTPPTLEEVKAYCEERKSPVDPVRFFEYFQTGGWKDSKGNPVRNWKQKLITWEKHSESQPQKKQNQFLQFEQHEYDFDALEKELLQN